MSETATHEAIAARYSTRLGCCSVKVREIAEDFETLVDFFAFEIRDPVGAEFFDRKGPHHAAVEDRAAQHAWRQMRLRCKIAEEASGKAVACACRVHHFLKRQRGCA